MGQIAKIIESANKAGANAIELTALQTAEIRGANRDEALQAGQYFKLPDDLAGKVFPEPRFNNTPYVVVNLCNADGTEIPGEGARLFLSSLTKRVSVWVQEGKNVVPARDAQGRTITESAGGTACAAFAAAGNQLDGLKALQGKLMCVDNSKSVTVQNRNNPGSTALSSVMTINFKNVA